MVELVASVDERGDTLVELLVALWIIFWAFTAFLSALSTASFSVALARERVTAENLARAQLECIQDLPYIDGAAPISYTAPCTVTVPQLPTYPIDLSISYWISSTAFTSNPADDNSGMQWITVTIRHKGEEVFEIGNYKVNR